MAHSCRKGPKSESAEGLALSRISQQQREALLSLYRTGQEPFTVLARRSGLGINGFARLIDEVNREELANERQKGVVIGRFGRSAIFAPIRRSA